jgi:hypothetical protein
MFQKMRRRLGLMIIMACSDFDILNAVARSTARVCSWNVKLNFSFPFLRIVPSIDRMAPFCDFEKQNLYYSE